MKNFGMIGGNNTPTKRLRDVLRGKGFGFMEASQIARGKGWLSAVSESQHWSKFWNPVLGRSPRQSPQHCDYLHTFAGHRIRALGRIGKPLHRPIIGFHLSIFSF